MQPLQLKEGYKVVKSQFGYLDIPHDWQIIPLKELGEIITGGTPETAKREYYGSQYLWATPTDLGSRKYIENTSTRLSSEGFGISRKVPKGSVLVVCIGSTIGKIGIAAQETSTNQQINSIVCNNYDGEFVYYQLLHNQHKIKNLANHVAVPILNKTDFSTLKIVIPKNIFEQQKIAFILSKVDALIQKTGEIIEQTRRLKKGLMQKILRSGIGHTRFRKVKFFLDELEEIPENWSILPIKEVIDSFKNGIYKPPEFYGRGLPDVRMFNIKEGEVNTLNAPLLAVDDSEIKDYGLQVGDILINRVNAIEYVGRAGVVKSEFGKAVFDSMIMRLRIRTDICNPFFLAHFMNSPLFTKQVISFVKPAINQASISQDDISRISLILPPLEEQQKITEIIDRVNTNLNLCVDYSKRASRLKKGLMQKLLTGKIRVKV